MNAEAGFDYARLLTVCADWSQEIVPATPAVNAVLDLLPRPHQGAFAKEDGELILDEQGKRLV